MNGAATRRRERDAMKIRRDERTYSVHVCKQGMKSGVKV